MLGILFVVMVLGLEGAKPFAIEGIFTARRSWSFGRAATMAALAVVAVAYSLTAELSLMPPIRADSAAQGTLTDDAAPTTGAGPETAHGPSTATRAGARQPRSR